MQKVLGLGAVFLLVSSAMTAQQPEMKPIEHGAFVTKALEECRQSAFKTTKDNAIKPSDAGGPVYLFAQRWGKAVTTLGVIAAQRSQGINVAAPDGIDEMSHVQIRFYELYGNISDDTLFGLSDFNVGSAPSSTFAGLVAYDSHGKEEAHLIAKAKRWYLSGERVGEPAHYADVLVSDNHSVVANPHHIVYAKWGDLKSRIAFDGTPEKQAEDQQLKKDALGRALDKINSSN